MYIQKKFAQQRTFQQYCSNIALFQQYCISYSSEQYCSYFATFQVYCKVVEMFCDMVF